MAAAHPMIALRPALAADIAPIQAIYAHHVLHGTGSFEIVPPSVEDIARRWAARAQAWLLAEDATGPLGYGYIGQYRDRAGYRFCAEDSIYIRPDMRGHGIGRRIGAALLEQATAAGYRQIVAVIGDAANTGSIALHASLGFRHVGQLHAVGHKGGRWLDVVLMQRALGEGSETPIK